MGFIITHYWPPQLADGRWEGVEAGVGWDSHGKGDARASRQRWYSNTSAWRNRRSDADACALPVLKKLVVDADACARRYLRDDVDAGERRSKTVVANAGARWKKRGRRGVDVAELFVRIFRNNDDRKNWKRSRVRGRRHLLKYWYRRTLLSYRRRHSPEAGGKVVDVAIS